MTPTARNGDTPRTDAVTGDYNTLAKHARELERELADMTADRDSETRWACQYKAERDAAAKLRGALKTIDKAGDAEAYWHARYVACKAERDAASESAKLRGPPSPRPQARRQHE